MRVKWNSDSQKTNDLSWIELVFDQYSFNERSLILLLTPVLHSVMSHDIYLIRRTLTFSVLSERSTSKKPNPINSSTPPGPPGPIIDPTVTRLPGARDCQPVTARQLQWNWTPAGQVSLQPCPIGANGLARWYCADEAAGPQWQGTSPDMSDCKSTAITGLEEQVRQNDPENVLVSSLAYNTRTKSLFGGDLEAVVTIMRTVASRIQYRLQTEKFHDKVNHIRQVLLNVLRSAANILEDGPNRQAWLDLSADRQMKVATSLMLALEENAFLLAGVTDQPQEILETYETLSEFFYYI